METYAIFIAITAFIIRKFMSWDIKKGRKRSLELSDDKEFNNTESNNIIINHFDVIDFNNAQKKYKVDTIINTNNIEIILNFNDKFINIYYVNLLIDFLEKLGEVDTKISTDFNESYINKGIVTDFVNEFPDEIKASLEKIQLTQIAIYPEDANFCQYYYTMKNNDSSVLTVNIDSDFNVKNIEIEGSN